jgi:hypothetical protein
MKIRLAYLCHRYGKDLAAVKDEIRSNYKNLDKLRAATLTK